MADWAELPPELLQFISRRLPSHDYMSFAGVCTSWRSVATKNDYNPKTRPPWLIVFLNRSINFFSFAGPEKGCRQLYRVLLKFYSSRGWIATGGFGRKLFLLNPLSRVAMSLPAVTYYQTDFQCIRLFAISASPSQSAKYSVVICDFHSIGQVWAWRSEQRVWTRVEVPPTYSITQLIHYKGQFVALANGRQILTLDDDDNMADVGFTVRMFVEGCYHYLVECSGSLLLICKYRDRMCQLEPSGRILWVGEDKGTVFRVVELDLERRNWREVKSLGNASLFLNGKFCASASFSVELDKSDESSWDHMTVKPNCIYFKEDQGEIFWGIYHMDSRHVERKFQEEEWVSRMRAWFQPCF